MNIFFLDKDPIKAAQYLCNRHVLKMGIEGLQMLSAAHHLCSSRIDLSKIYPLSWQYHPCSKWVRKCYDNYKWLWEHCDAIFREYTYRYEKTHLCVKSGKLSKLACFPILPDVPFTFPYLGMPFDCHSSDYVESYRNYYQRYKVGKIQMKYTKRPIPFWLKLEN